MYIKMNWTKGSRDWPCSKCWYPFWTYALFRKKSASHTSGTKCGEHQRKPGYPKQGSYETDIEKGVIQGQVQGHLFIFTGLALNLKYVMAIVRQTTSRSSQGHGGIYYWINLKLKVWNGNYEPNKFKVMSMSSGYYFWIVLKLRASDHDQGPNMAKVMTRSWWHLSLDYLTLRACEHKSAKHIQSHPSQGHQD